jgi:hypothetical protein
MHRLSKPYVSVLDTLAAVVNTFESFSVCKLIYDFQNLPAGEYRTTAQDLASVNSL